MKHNKKTLFTVESKDYSDFRLRMVEDLVDVELDSPQTCLMEMLEELVTDMFMKMDDDSLQNHYNSILGDGEENE
jgi:hypothetical protein